MQYQKWVQSCQPAGRVALDILLPDRCLLCRAPARGFSLCDPCLQGLPRVDRPCSLCGLPLGNDCDRTCGGCTARPPPWDGLQAPLCYGFPVDRLVHQFKFRRNLAAGRALAVLMARGVRPRAHDMTRLVPVPLHWTRHMARGYNQAAVLAWELSRRVGRPPPETGLRRQRRTVAQTGLDAAARRRNLRGAFCWRGSPLKGAGVVLVDDVMTTGSTARACVRALKRAGAQEVEVWVAARALVARAAR